MPRSTIATRVALLTLLVTSIASCGGAGGGEKGPTSPGPDNPDNSGTPSATVVVTPVQGTLEVGLTHAMQATVTGLTNTAVTWTSSSDGIAPISAAGVLRAEF